MRQKTARVGRLVEEKVEESRVVASMKGGTEQVVGKLGDQDAPAPVRRPKADLGASHI